ncbi:hypothetical protein KDA_69460 [Dictyobacter alpinus]|uniref:Uncharacterized protein n=1 Tax=Dictyobacter alpinus TaxID=2014873 RepID=A0A402BJD9_9CHLR|nr:hypothetical protein [Dictyobacter alpinus]GCE31462.1 hypothetical protein KDA_69460 [Dictyobacter alpinus]
MPVRKKTFINNNVTNTRKNINQAVQDTQEIERLTNLLPIDDEKATALLSMLMVENHKILRLSLLESF